MRSGTVHMERSRKRRTMLFITEVCWNTFYCRISVHFMKSEIITSSDFVVQTGTMHLIWQRRKAKVWPSPVHMPEICGAFADYLKALEKQCGRTEIEILEEMQMSLSDEDTLYTDIRAKQELLKTYTKKCRHNVSGRTVAVAIDELTESLYSKADWMMEYIRQKEWVNDGADHAWFNSYYDNHGNRVEGKYDNNVRMMLTGQVFAIMSGTADEKQVQAVCESADTYLYDKDAGGYRLNTNFHENKFDLGRMFGFAYGGKKKTELCSRI